VSWQRGLRSSQGGLTAAQQSAEGIVGGTSSAEGLNDGRTLKSRLRTPICIKPAGSRRRVSIAISAVSVNHSNRY
jgi:hypothetical protein